MKLQKLSIKNIASIEYAEIKFSQPPLSESPIFLITGDTGAGKTTILNAICLALYNRVPSLETIGTAENDREGIRTDNPRQLVRRGAVSAEIILTIADSSGKVYNAKWSVRRARNKADGKMQRTERELEDVAEGVVYNREEDIKEIILKVTGLTFDQFTRTTMLAQGQFATFMKAKDADKSEILEKLTGTEVYARIGNRIFEKLAEKKDALSAIENEIKGRRQNFLTEKEIEELHKTIEMRTALNEQLTHQIQTLNIQIQWLTQYALLKKEAEKREEILKKAEEAVESEENRYKETIVKAWKQTTEIRHLIADNSSASSHAENLKNDINALIHQAYPPILRGLRWLKDIRNSLQKQKEELDSKANAEAKNSKLYSEASRIEEKSKNVERQTELAKELHDKHSKQTAEYNKSLPIEEEAKKKQTEAIEKYTKLAKETEKLAKEIAGTDIASLSETVNANNNELSRLNDQQQAIENYRNKLTEHTESTHALKETEDAMNQTLFQLSEAKKHLPIAEKLLKDRVQILDARMQLNDHIKELRQRFADTHECPLCGSRVDGLIHQETLDKGLGEARKAEQDARDSLETLTRNISALEARLSSQEADVKTKNADEINKRNALEKAENTAKSLADDYNEDDVMTRIENERNIIIERQSVNKNALDDALAKRQAYDNAAKLSDKARKALDKANDTLRKIQDSIKAQELEIRSTLMLSKQAEDNAATFLSEIRSAVGDFAYVDVRNYAEIASTISRRAEEYADTVIRAEETDRQIKETDATIERCQVKLKPISEKAEKVETSDSAPMKDIETGINSITEKLSRYEGQLASYLAKISSTEKEIAEYFSEAGAYDRNYLHQLDSITKGTIDKYEDNLNKIAEYKSLAKGAIEALTNQIKAHESIRPEIPEDNDIDKIIQIRKITEENREANMKEKVAAETNLRNDAASKKALESKIKTFDTLQEEKNKWQQLENLFGGAGGRKFRNLAQSYVLRALLAKANHYLTRLNNRYTLDCEDGSLTINVIDHRQGGCIRNVGLLSGGEGFIVSLALALGLSAISKQRIDVDILFIDEGFGSLDQETLETVITTLNNLHRIGNRRIGVISHVSALKERIFTQIRVTHDTPTSSKVTVCG